LLQIPFWQPPAGQVWQSRPPIPHAPSTFPGWQVLPEQHPLGHDVPSHTQAPATQRCPAPQGAPLPHWQVPVAEQLSVVAGSHATHAAPPTPQVARARALQAPAAQQPPGHEVASHVAGISSLQVGEQPSPAAVLPSSHSSIGLRTMPSPQIAGAPRVRVALTIWPATTATSCCSLPTTVIPARPSTRKRTDVPASAGGSTMVAVSWPLVSGRGGSGSVPGSKAGEPSLVVPEIASTVRASAGS